MANLTLVSFLVCGMRPSSGMLLGSVCELSILCLPFLGAGEGLENGTPGVPDVTLDGLAIVCENSDSVDIA